MMNDTPANLKETTFNHAISRRDAFRCSWLQVTIGGTVVGAGIGAMAGDAEMGAVVGMTAGTVHDIFGR